MKKAVLIISTVAVLVSIGLYVSNHKNKTQQMKYADARLSALELKQGIEIKIRLMLDDVADERVVVTEKGLITLMQAINTLRVHGKDISKKAKNNLTKIAKQLKMSGFQNRSLLRKLDEIARSSHVISA